MVGPQPAPTKADRRRFDALHELGCIACRVNGVVTITTVEIHHLVEGNKRLGHSFTIPLCAWHHRGDAENAMEMLKGPSLARNKRAFAKEYGTERELLAAVNRLIHVVGGDFVSQPLTVINQPLTFPGHR